MKKKHLFPVISGILTIIALFELQPWLGAIALVPLLYALTNASLKDNFKITTLFAITIGFGLFYWIPSSAGVFSGQWFTGAMASLLFMLLFVAHFLLVFVSYHYLKKEEAIIQNALLLAALMVLAD